jgi:hypothetical protein
VRIRAVTTHCRPADGVVVRAEGDDKACMDPILAGQLIAKADAARRNRLGALKACDVTPRRPSAGEARASRLSGAAVLVTPSSLGG